MKHLTHEELETVELWANTLDKDKRDNVLALVAEAHEHRKLRGALHDELINDMS